MNIIGYRLAGNQEICRGTGYEYILAGNGIWLSADSQFLIARINIAPAVVRGLTDLDEVIMLKHGKIPRRLFDRAISVFMNRREKEVYIAIVREKEEYRLVIPGQEASSSSVKYSVPENIILELHSHPGCLSADFSDIDDADEQGFKIYGGVAEMDEAEPAINLRLGIYGYYRPLQWCEVFEGELAGAIDVNAIETAPEPEGERENSWWHYLFGGWR